MALWLGLPLLHAAHGLGEVASMRGTKGRAALHACARSGTAASLLIQKFNTSTKIQLKPYILPSLSFDPANS
jgi:hypothetical protein